MSDRVTRRGVLASVGALSLTGCLGDAVPADSTVTTTPDGRPSVTFTADVLQSFTDGHPASLRLGLGTGGDEPLVVRWNVSGGQGGPFNHVWGVRGEGNARVGVFRRDGSAALCAEADGPIPDAPVGGCWKPRCAGIDFPTSLHGRFEFAPDDPVADEYVVLDGTDGPCLPRGSYAFDESRAKVNARVARGAVEDGSVTTRSAWYSLERHLTLSIDDNGAVTASARAVVAPLEPSEPDDSAPQSTPKPAGRPNGTATRGVYPPEKN